jgi:hypothetical protein
MRQRVESSSSFIAFLLIAANIAWSAELDPRTAWRDKPVSEWTAEDAKKILTNSPWSKKVATVLLRLQSEAERRDGGNMGRPQGVGYDHIEGAKSTTKADGDPIFLPRRSKDGLGAIGTVVQLRWETALPVRLAELKAHVMEPPTLEGDGFVLAVYGVPGQYFHGAPESLGEPLKKLAALKREGKKDIRPIRVEVFQRDQDLVVAYVFSQTEEITKSDKFLQFEAQIGRFVVTQVFDVGEMRFQGKLEM